MSSGIPAWIRTKNEGVKGLSVTVTPRGYCVQSTPAVLPSLDSNQDKQLQRLRCYRYTTGEYAFRVRLLLTEQLLVLFRPLNRCPLKTDGSNCPTGHTTNNDASTFHRLIICLSLFLEHETSLAQPTRKPGSVLANHLSSPEVTNEIKRLSGELWRETNSHEHESTFLAADRVYHFVLSPVQTASSYLALFTLTSKKRFSFCDTFPRVAPGCS